MRDYLAALLQLFIDRREDSMILLAGPGEMEKAFKDASEYVYALMITRLEKMDAKASVITENSDRVVRGRGHDGFEFVHNDGTQSKFITVNTPDDEMMLYEAADRSLLCATIDSLIDQLWEEVRKHIHGTNVWFLTTPKLWYNFRAGKVEFRIWCVLAD